MKVLVSDTNNTYSEWVHVRNLEDVMHLKGNIDYLVFNRSGDSSDIRLNYLSAISKNYPNCVVIYLCNKDMIDYDTKMLITGGLKGKYVDDEFYLENDRELNNLLLSLSKISKVSELAGTDVVSNFFNNVMTDSSQVSKGYLAVVKDAVIDIISGYNEKNLEIIKMSEIAADIFNNSIETISQMKENVESVKTSFENYRIQQENMAKFSMNSNDLAVTYFPKILIPCKSPLIRIKDVDESSFLTSFLLGFRKYLENVRNVRPKIIFIKPNNEVIEKKYDDFKWVTKQNYTDSANYYGDVVFTDYPIRKVLTKLLSDNEYDTFILVDGSKNFLDHIVNSVGSVIYAISGNSSVNKFNLKANECFTVNSNLNGALFKVPYFSDYPDRSDLRINKYLSECEKYYDILFDRKSL